MARKRKIIFDFDGVIHRYQPSGWKGTTVIPEPPVKGTKEAIAAIREHYDVYVMSTRCFQEGGIDAITNWLEEHDIEVDGIIAEKVPASLMVDDRGYRFDGSWNNLIEFLNTPGCMDPWNAPTEWEPPIVREIGESL